MADPTNRAAALARLNELGAKPELGATADEPKVTRTGDEVYAGGEEARLLVSPAHLTYREGTNLLYADASPGDTILVTKAQAKRLDAFGVTVAVDADDEDVADAVAGEVTDEQLRSKTAAELVAYATQNPDERARVYALEVERPEDKRRATVLKVTAPETVEEVAVTTGVDQGTPTPPATPAATIVEDGDVDTGSTPEDEA